MLRPLAVAAKFNADGSGKFNADGSGSCNMCGGNMCGGNMCGGNMCGGNMCGGNMCGGNMCGGCSCGRAQLTSDEMHPQQTSVCSHTPCTSLRDIKLKAKKALFLHHGYLCIPNRRIGVGRVEEHANKNASATTKAPSANNTNTQCITFFQ
jgi:hypothetical protein